MSSWPPLAGVLLLSVVLSAPVSSQRPPGPTGQPYDTVSVTLRDMVTSALGLSLPLRSERLTRDMAASNLLRVRAAFDPAWSLSLGRSASSTTVVGDTLYEARTHALTAGLDGYLPTSTSYSLGLSASDAFADPIQSSVGSFAHNYSTGLSLQLTQPLLRGFGPGPAGALVRAARHSSRAAGDDFQRAVERTIAAVENAFWLLRYGEAVEDIARASLDRAREILDRNVVLRERDLVTELDVITARRTVALREITLLDAQRQRVDAADALAFLVYGEEAAAKIGEGLLRTAGQASAHSALAQPDDPETAGLSARRDLEAARARRRSAEVRLELAQNRLRPALDLTFGIEYGGTSSTFTPYAYHDPDDSRNALLSFGASFRLPVLNRSSRAEMDEATLLTQRADLDVFVVENRIRTEVRTAVRGVRLSLESLDSSERVVALAEEEYRMARTGFELGQLTTFQLFQYEEDLLSARVARAQDEHAYAAAAAAYRLAVGRIGDDYGLDRPAVSR